MGEAAISKWLYTSDLVWKVHSCLGHCSILKILFFPDSSRYSFQIELEITRMSSSAIYCPKAGSVAAIALPHKNPFRWKMLKFQLQCLSRPPAILTPPTLSNCISFHQYLLTWFASFPLGSPATSSHFFLLLPQSLGEKSYNKIAIG